jgi:MYXO-CTERM domain-containing protein
MHSRHLLRSFITLAGVVALSVSGAVAQAGIIVTVGRPCPEISLQKATSPDARQQQSGSFMTEGAETRCVVMPDGQTKCGKSIRVESVSMLPADWRCTPVAKGTLYCETPSFGASPGAAGEGDFDPDAHGEDFLSDEQIETLGCSGGAGPGALTGALGLLLIGALRRRRVRAR